MNFYFFDFSALILFFTLACFIKIFSRNNCSVRCSSIQKFLFMIPLYKIFHSILSTGIFDCNLFGSFILPHHYIEKYMSEFRYRKFYLWIPKHYEKRFPEDRSRITFNQQSTIYVKKSTSPKWSSALSKISKIFVHFADLK